MNYIKMFFDEYERDVIQLYIQGIPIQEIKDIASNVITKIIHVESIIDKYLTYYFGE
jgi:hypothetical protein